MRISVVVQDVINLVSISRVERIYPRPLKPRRSSKHRRSANIMQARSKHTMRDHQRWRAAMGDPERDFWKNVARTRNLKAVLDAPPPTVVQTLLHSRVLTVIQSLQVWKQVEVPGDDVTVLDESLVMLGRYLDLKVTQQQIVLHRPHIVLLYETSTWNVGSALKTFAKSMQQNRPVVLRTESGSHFRLVPPDEVEFQPAVVTVDASPQPSDVRTVIDKEMAEKVHRLARVPPTKLLARSLSVDSGAVAPPPADPEDVSRRLHDETTAALDAFRQSQKKSLGRRLDRDGAAIEAETDALMTYLGAYSASANHALITLRGAIA